MLTSGPGNFFFLFETLCNFEIIKSISSGRSMSRRMPRRPHPSGGTPLPPTVSEAMELTGGGAEAMDTV